MYRYYLYNDPCLIYISLKILKTMPLTVLFYVQISKIFIYTRKKYFSLYHEFRPGSIRFKKPIPCQSLCYRKSPQDIYFKFWKNFSPYGLTSSKRSNLESKPFLLRSYSFFLFFVANIIFSIIIEPIIGRVKAEVVVVLD